MTTPISYIIVIKESEANMKFVYQELIEKVQAIDPTMSRHDIRHRVRKLKLGIVRHKRSYDYTDRDVIKVLSIPKSK